MSQEDKAKSQAEVDLKSEKSGPEKRELGEFLQSMFKHENDLPKEKALQLLRNHVGGSWNNCTTEDLDLSIIT